MQLDYPFEQVPLRTSGNHTAAPVDGIATIVYRSATDWHCGPILIEYLDWGPVPLGVTDERKLAKKHVRASPADACIIADHLATKDRPMVEECLAECIRQAEANGDADARIDAFKEAV